MSYASLCNSCAKCRTIVSGTGSRFLLCTLAQTDRRFAKYPPQPVVRCTGFAAKGLDAAERIPGDDASPPGS